jgi:hypothetical protein
MSAILLVVIHWLILSENVISTVKWMKMEEIQKKHADKIKLQYFN